MLFIERHRDACALSGMRPTLTVLRHLNADTDSAALAQVEPLVPRSA